MAIERLNCKAPAKRALPNRQYGFTLLELMVALTVFAVFSAMAYQSLVQIWSSHVRLTTSAVEQSEHAMAYRTLSTAFSSNFSLKGTASTIEIDRSSVDSLAILQRPITSLQLRDNSLVDDTTPILTGLKQAKFSFIDDSQHYPSWSKPHTPEFVEFYWQTETQEQRWLFAIQ